MNSSLNSIQCNVYWPYEQPKVTGVRPFLLLFSPFTPKNARYLATIGLYNGENNNNNTVTVKYKENSKYIAAKFNGR